MQKEKNMDKTFMEAMDYRHACKVFDDTKKD